MTTIDATKPESLEKSSEYLRLALTYMGQHSIPVTPTNYAIWYEYVSGKNPNLINAIDKRMKSLRPFSNEFNEDVYQKFIVDEQRQRSTRVLTKIRSMLSEISKQAIDAGGDISSHGGVLEFYSKKLKDTLDLSGIRLVVDGILTETAKMVETGESLRERLVNTTKEVETLRTELERVKEKATTDALTGIANRHAFQEALAKSIETASTKQTPLSVLMMDIDFFKKVNDTFGHLVGDQVLRLTGMILKTFVKGRDYPARYGGEEFVVLLPETPIRGARILGEKIRVHFEKNQWKRKDTGKTLGSVTVSVGVTEYVPGETSDDFLKRADQALYDSKENGRNRVTVRTAS